MRSLPVASLINCFAWGDSYEILLVSPTVLLLALAGGGWLIVSADECSDTDWNEAVRMLPACATYDPGSSEFAGGYEVSFVPPVADHSRAELPA